MPHFKFRLADMRGLALTAVIVLLTQVAPKTARDYYNEIYAAGGLDRMADGHVCFDEDPKLDTFFIFGESKDIREFMMADGTFSKMPKDMQAKLKTDFLIVRNYEKGVPAANQDFYEKDGESWVTEKFKVGKECCLRVRFTINTQTLRYKRAVEILNPDSTYRSEKARFGRCETVAADVQQHGD